jgi:hypothetical protein
VDHILAQASVTETEVTREALKAAVDALDDEAPAAT